MGLIRKIVFLLLFITYISQIVPVTPLDTTALYKEVGYEDPTVIEAAYAAGIAQATNGVTTGNLNEVISGLTAAAAADHITTFGQMMSGQAFGRTNMVKTFKTNDDLESIITPVAKAFFGDEDSTSYITQYVNTGIADDNFATAMKGIEEGIYNRNLQQVLDSLEIVNNYPGDRLMGLFKMELADVGGYYSFSPGSSQLHIGSAISDELISNFDIEDIVKICNAAKLDDADILEIYEANKTYISNIEKIQTAYQNVNANDMATTLSEMIKTNPNLTSKLFQNGNALDYQTLNKAGFTDAQITQIAQAGGLQAADITNYLAGNYTGASDTPVLPNPNGDLPTGPVNTGIGTQAGDNIPGAQEYDTLQAATVESLQALIKSESWTKSDFETLISMQKASLDRLQASGKATAEAIAEKQNEINASEKALDDPTTEFTPEPVDPVVAA